MKTCFKKVISIFLTVVILLTAAPMSGFAGLDFALLDFSTKSSALDATGQCGDNVYWTFDKSTGALTISGTGKIYNYCAECLYGFGEIEIIACNSPFNNCNSIKKVIIEDGIINIGSGMFYRCENLTSITIPDSVTSIDLYAFFNTGYYNNPNNWENGVLYIGKHLIKANNNVSGNYQIKAGTKKICDFAFSNCTELSGVTIPNSVTSIGDQVFCECTKLTSINIPDKVISIGSYAFYDCTGLVSITIPDSVTSIGQSAFYNTGYYNNPDNWENDVLYMGKHLIKAKDCLSGNYQIKANTKTIVAEAFKQCRKLTSATIPNSVTSIGRYAFSECIGLKSVTIPDSVTSIGWYAFSSCAGLTNVTIPDSVTSIGWYAFSGCIGLISVTIGNSVENIGDYAFYNCSGLTSIKIPDSVTSIGSYAFYDCSGLTNVTIGKGITSIDIWAFSGCNIELLNYNAENCESAANVFSNSGVKKVVISENVKKLPDKIFASCGDLQDVVFESAGYIDVSDSAFFDSANVVICCKENSCIHSYAQMNGIKYRLFDSLGEPTFTVKNDVLISYSGEQADLFVRAASKIGYGAFSGNTSLRSVELAGDVTRIFNHAFKDCANLEKIIIPQSVTSIGDNTFDGCPDLTVWCYAGSYAESYAVSKNIPVKYINLQLSENVVELDELESAVLLASYNTDLSEEYDMVWTSDNPSVVTVTQDGKITAVGVGEATITATSSSGLYAKCIVKVTRTDTPEEKGAVKGVKIDDIKLNYKKSAVLKPVITADDGVKYTVKYESSNPKIATVDQSGKVTAAKRGSGSATITCTVTDEYGNVVKDSCTVKVSLSFGQKIIVYVLFGWIWY